MNIALHGFLMGLSLIVAIGPQNTLLLRQGIRRTAVGAVVAVCLISECMLIIGSTAGVGVIIDKAPAVLDVMKYLGFVYLLWFAFTSFRDALRTGGGTFTRDGMDPEVPADLPPGDTDGTGPGIGTGDGSSVAVAERTARVIRTAPERTWVKPVLAALAMTWLNPATYVDIVVMLGGIANQYGEVGRWYFAAGALAASTIWMPSIGYGAKKLSGPLSRPDVARIVNIAIGIVMIAIAVRLLLH
ncbi:LysE/ArgO family amino acid transporter [Corynebacterium sp. CCM 9185]|uniref:Amino acid transporter n=1 Tax=Corynebacterium marambiense TaxID=2765364 RepID=A0ABS0VVC5_9CORY|nr:LysE/ArgO family amino acid transporter [Corynebacterium marambiense]MBI9000244.1 amino acid transporter [Corynebacterium marambiense]MCK7663598.1 LysE/ArgO family amino acid transporter [Corynebacterium marambiense]MCX7541968.1 LysE/ArgO family amino acid transporter [Corynebacterium marambiense]